KSRAVDGLIRFDPKDFHDRWSDVDVMHARYYEVFANVGSRRVKARAHLKKLGIVAMRAVEIGEREDARRGIVGGVGEPCDTRILGAVEIVSFIHNREYVA